MSKRGLESLKDSCADIHVIPLYDIKEHTCVSNCWCQPVRDDEYPTVLVHNSGDGREDFESGKRLVS
jgi:hypothetical protein